MTPQAIRLGINASALGDDIRQAPRVARALGVAGLQFDPFGSSLDLTKLSQTGRREFLRLLAGQDQQLASLRVNWGNDGFGVGADVQKLVDRLDKVLETAAGLGGAMVCVDLGLLPEPPREVRTAPKITADQAGLLILPPSIAAPPPPPPAPISQPNLKLIAQVDEALAEIGRRADRYNTIIAFRSDLSSLAAVERAIRTAACSWFGVDFDPVDLLRDQWEPDESFSRLGSLIRQVRGRDALRGSDRRTQAAVIGAGNVNWGEFIANLDAAAYRGWLIVDPMEFPNRLRAAEAGVKYLKPLITAG